MKRKMWIVKAKKDFGKPPFLWLCGHSRESLLSHLENRQDVLELSEIFEGDVDTSCGAYYYKESNGVNRALTFIGQEESVQ